MLKSRHPYLQHRELKIVKTFPGYEIGIGNGAALVLKQGFAILALLISWAR